MIVRTPKHDRLNAAPDEVPGMPQGMSSCAGGPGFLPADLVLEPLSRKPTVLPETTVRMVYDLPAGSSGAVFSRSCFGILTIMRSNPEGRSQARRSDFADCVS